MGVLAATLVCEIERRPWICRLDRQLGGAGDRSDAELLRMLVEIPDGPVETGLHVLEPAGEQRSELAPTGLVENGMVADCSHEAGGDLVEKLVALDLEERLQLLLELLEPEEREHRGRGERIDRVFEVAQELGTLMDLAGRARGQCLPLRRRCDRFERRSGDRLGPSCGRLVSSTGRLVTSCGRLDRIGDVLSVRGSRAWSRVALRSRTHCAALMEDGGHLSTIDAAPCGHAHPFEGWAACLDEGC